MFLHNADLSAEFGHGTVVPARRQCAALAAIVVS